MVTDDQPHFTSHLVLESIEKPLGMLDLVFHLARDLVQAANVPVRATEAVK